MRSSVLISLLVCSLGAWAQSSSSTPSNTQSPDSTSTPASKLPARTPSLAPPRSDRVNAADLDNGPGESSSKDSPIDLSPPAGDDKAHPQSSEALMDVEGANDAGQVHAWNPHKAAKDIEVGDFYFKRKNYRAAEDRYREALLYKENDAVATFRVAVCLEKMEQPNEALKEYENYLKILPHGPQVEEAQKAIQRLKGPAASAKPTP
jgi:tetratricopeptide (TPR) repeat protein